MNNNGNVHVQACGAATVDEKHIGFKHAGSVATFRALGQWKVFRSSSGYEKVDDRELREVGNNLISSTSFCWQHCFVQDRCPFLGGKKYTAQQLHNMSTNQPIGFCMNHNNNHRIIHTEISIISEFKHLKKGFYLKPSALEHVPQVAVMKITWQRRDDPRVCPSECVAQLQKQTFPPSGRL